MESNVPRNLAQADSHSGDTEPSDYEDFLTWSEAALRHLAETQKGKWVALENGMQAPRSSVPGMYRYTFDKPSDDFLPIDIAIAYRPNARTKPKDAVIVFASETQVDIELPEDLGQTVARIEVKADARTLLYKLSNRLIESRAPSQITLKLALGKKADFQKLGIRPNERDILDVAASQDLTFVWGPPGTGKTYQLSLLAERFISKGLRVLMVSGANVAVDEATKDVSERLKGFPLGTVVRYGNPRNTELDEGLLTSRALVRANNVGLLKREQALLEARETAVAQQLFDIESELKRVRRDLRHAETDLALNAMFLATTLARASVDPTIYEQHFDVVFYDEVGMALVPQVVFASTLATKSMCCFGDFRQLPPIVDDRVPELKQDIFDKLGITDTVNEKGTHDLLVMLTEQRRCHPEIAEFVSVPLYDGLLTTHLGTANKTSLKCREYLGECGSMCLADISGMPALGLKDASSHFNLMSASICVGLAKSMPKDWNIAIITPYKSQAQIIRGMIRDTCHDREGIRSATVHSFQGAETEAVIFDVVDCAPRDSLGLLLRETNGQLADRLMNVAITRAKFKFLIVANVTGMRDIYPQKGLLLRNYLDLTKGTDRCISGNRLLGLMSNDSSTGNYEFFEGASSQSAWDTLIEDISGAKRDVIILMSRTLRGTPEQVNRLCTALDEASQRRVSVEVYGKASRDLPPRSWRHEKELGGLPNTAMMVVDDEVLWNGLPCCWLKDHNGTRLSFDPIFRISGGHAAKEVSRIYKRKIDYINKRVAPSPTRAQNSQLSLNLGI